MARIAPRAFIALEGLTDNVSFAPAVHQAWLAARPVYQLLGATDRLGVNHANHAHAFTNDDWAAILAFADKNMLGKKVDRAFDQWPPVADGVHFLPRGPLGRTHCDAGRQLGDASHLLRGCAHQKCHHYRQP